MDRCCFLTGVSGFLGQELLRLLAENPDNKIYCFMRNTGRQSASERFLQILSELGLEKSPADLELVEGDIREPRMGMEDELYERLTNEITNIIHSAADVRFNQPVEKIRSINTGGTRNILDLTEKCVERNPKFSHLDYVSTAFVAGRRSGVSPEYALLNGCGFKNTYEQTKFEAEQAVRSRLHSLPAIIFRPSIVLGFSENGEARPRNVIYPMVKLFAKWRFPVISALPSTRLDLVPVDFVARSILHISRPENAGQCFHLAAGPEGDVSLGQFIKIMGEEFDKKVFILPPAFWKLVVRPLLKTFKRDFYEKSTGIFRAFEPYIWEQNPRYSVEATRKALQNSDIDLPDSEQFLRRCLVYARESDFGRRTEGS